MEQESNKKRRTKKPRQAWDPHVALKILYRVWMIAFGAFKIALGAMATVFLIVVICGFVFLGILGDYLQDDVLPASVNFSLDISDMEQTSFVYCLDGDGNIKLLQQVHTVADRQWAYFDEIPENLIHAAIAIEDKRFYEHQGVDWITTVKACINMFMGGESQFGGSTITQQLVKNKTEEDSITVQRKVTEIFRALNAEREYEKDTIMEWYLNTIYFGRGCYGVKSAAAEYFGKELNSLTIAECASLISITNNPSLYNPYRLNLDKSGLTGAEQNRERQLNTLSEMKKQGWITEEEYAEAQAQEMVFKEGIAAEDRWAKCKNEACGYEGTVGTFKNEGASYFCPQCGTQNTVDSDASQEVYSYMVDTVLEDVASDLAAMRGVDWDSLDKEGKLHYMTLIQLGGYHIYSTIDLSVQNQVDKIYQNINEIPTTKSNQQLQSAIVVIDNRTGDIVAMAGGVGDKKEHDGFNRATDAKLQTGSAQKPISVYAPAFESGAISPVTVLRDMPIEGKFPKNDDGKYQYGRTVFSGIVSSVNTISCRSLGLIGFEYAYNFAKDNFGISTLTDHYVREYDGQVMNDLAYSPLAMGALTIGATVRDMSAAYATFANNGVYREARTYTKVYNSEGELILDNTQDSRQILGEKALTYMNLCLYNAANHGTGTSAIFRGMNIAGKTGTTSNYRDRWFCGYTPYYTAAVWCGYDHPERIYLTGSTANPAARLWKKVMEPIHTGKENKALYNGDSLRGATVCLDSGKLATAACRRDVRGFERTSFAYAYREDLPGVYCDKHVDVEYCISGGGVATEYCKLMPDGKIELRSLVKLKQQEVNEINHAKVLGLNPVYAQDYYVYFITNSGNPLVWKGFTGAHADNNQYAYVVCPVHTKEAYDKLKAEQEKAEQEKQEQENQTPPATGTENN